MATAWKVAAATAVVGWLVMPIITFFLPTIINRLGFGTLKKLEELEIRIIPELQQTLCAVDQERMLERGKKLKSDVAVLDKMAGMLRHARDEAEDIFDADHNIESRCRWSWLDILFSAVGACLWIVGSGLARLRRSEDSVPVNIRAATSDEPIAVTIDIAASDEQAVVPVAISTGEASNEPFPLAAPSDSSPSNFNVLKNRSRFMFYWLVDVFEAACFYRNWSYEVVGITNSQVNVTPLDFLITAFSRQSLNKRIEKVESTISEVKKSPLLGTESKSAAEDIANKNRSRIKAASNRKVFGRETLRDSIMAKLRETPHGEVSSTSTSPCYSAFGIYGVAGSGKTTFARYTRDYIKEECKEEGLFDTIICIHLSETFSVDDIFHEMLKDITKDRNSSISDREELEEKLKESLRGKRFCLILDDLWIKTKNDPQLEELTSPLIVGLKGSKILVTARTKAAAGVLCAGEPMEMPYLDEHQYLSLFMHYALGGTRVADEEFKRVGGAIAKKLHGSPIAAVIVAGWLGANRDISFWKNAAELDMLNDTMDALWWSYQQLSSDIRRCFEYCNILPRRFRITKGDLVHLWIAQGFVKTSCAREDMEDVAEGYIQELVSSSFLQQEKTWYGDVFFTIHDLLRDLAEKVAGNDCFIIENEWSQRAEGCKADVPRDVRHLFIQNYDAELIIQKILGLENLRTLIVYVVPGSTTVEEKVIDYICKRLPKLRVLAIAYINQDSAMTIPKSMLIPESIGRLKHLRYLAFRTSRSCRVILPSALSKLQYIQFLHFGAGEILEFTFADLITLRHIICASMKSRNIGCLISLQTMVYFTVSNELGHEVKQLRNLNKLRGRLEIYGLEYVKSKEEALEANLAAKERLLELTLVWGYGDDTRCSQEVEAAVLEGLCPPVRLEKLHVCGYEGSRYPDWIVGKQNGCPNYLQQLRFADCSQLRPTSLLAFPHLRVLMLSNCNWDALPGNMEHLTSLKTLEIIRCSNIRSLPTLPQSLERFDLLSCNKELMKSCQTVGHPYWQKIEHIPIKAIW